MQCFILKAPYGGKAGIVKNRTFLLPVFLDGLPANPAGSKRINKSCFFNSQHLPRNSNYFGVQPFNAVSGMNDDAPDCIRKIFYKLY